tara:strand:- start:13815 stop:14198 length:384 start_codon:yes stop_codon:yes gene_type:complete
LPILITFLISGCATTKQLEIFNTEVPKIPLNIELPPIEELEAIPWKILIEANQEEQFRILKEANMDPVFFSLSDEDYELLQKNNVRMRNQIIRYRQIIEAYKEYYESKDNESKPELTFEPKTFNKDD